MSGVGHVPASLKGYQIQKEDSEIRDNATNNELGLAALRILLAKQNAS